MHRWVGAQGWVQSPPHSGCYPFTPSTMRLHRLVAATPTHPPLPPLRVTATEIAAAAAAATTAAIITTHFLREPDSSDSQRKVTFVSVGLGLSGTTVKRVDGVRRSSAHVNLSAYAMTLCRHTGFNSVAQGHGIRHTRMHTYTNTHTHTLSLWAIMHTLSNAWILTHVLIRTSMLVQRYQQDRWQIQTARSPGSRPPTLAQHFPRSCCSCTWREMQR